MLMQLTSPVITLQIPLPPPHSISCNGNLSGCIGKCCACAVPPQQFPSLQAPLRHTSAPARPPSTSVAFFMTLQFSNLVPYIVILKTFHVKNEENLVMVCSVRSNLSREVLLINKVIVNGQWWWWRGERNDATPKILFEKF